VSDTESQSGTLDDFTYRRYAPVQGRWISPDPAGLAAVDPTNPQTWNRYAYVTNQPLNFTDPLGLCQQNNYTMASPGPNGPVVQTWTTWSPTGSWGAPCLSGPPPPGCMFISTAGSGEGDGPAGMQCGVGWAPPIQPDCPPSGCSSVSGGGGTGGTAPAPATPWYKNPCVQNALLKGAATAGLDAIGLIPEGGAVAGAFSLFHGAAGVSNGTNILGRVALGGSLISTGVSLSDASGPNGGATSFAAFQTGVNALGIAKTLFEAIPVAGQVIAAVAVVGDLVGAGLEIADCH
jgi:RHS repeat-associated protein